MYRARTLAAAAMMALVMSGPSAMATSTLGQPAGLHLVRGGGGRGGGFGGHGGGFRGGYAARRGWGYRPWSYGYGIGVLPYLYSCPYPYGYPFCISRTGDAILRAAAGAPCRVAFNLGDRNTICVTPCPSEARIAFTFSVPVEVPVLAHPYPTS